MKMYQVDAFSQQLFQGNPAAVLVLEQWLDEQLMQKIAAENNLSETAFVKILDAQNYEIRWFTPVSEIEFCGHATLASAFILFQKFTALKTIHFHSKKLGIFIISQADDGKICMNFPIRKAEKLSEYPEILNEALTKPIKAVYRNAQAYILEYQSVQDVLEETPDFKKLAELGNLRTAITTAGLDVAITAQAQQYDCVSRYFAPALGIDEDPVTGSIHTAIVPIWAEKLGKSQLVAYQASQRGGALFCKILDQDRIEIAGYACLFFEADILLP
ncbi:PhzF family phenazine biosynthesis protein [Acinetobacter qingfengensis]|uniref:Phenazine biosynthesis protein PhzF n=1 Tax=Acinetobacter qingfengensis TaxID=1262585 RepID=A0A1E7RE24_9GAMM|nr:PhzF family phenazine biosynthesis protein [Acinetobacter qingfengensis]KAA8734497.1 PhzF family phenazine biosynthesis protein [Acinetobacter qingfengensis]OEY97533.1 phenazine biosynthesis protein PhzF [Acinetobacter qingfengensis]